MSEPQRRLSVYDGSTLIGSAVGASHWRAFDARGNGLPVEFKAAVAAVNLSCPSPFVADARMDHGT